jgi:hypothetical protein
VHLVDQVAAVLITLGRREVLELLDKAMLAQLVEETLTAVVVVVRVLRVLLLHLVRKVVMAELAYQTQYQALLFFMLAVAVVQGQRLLERVVMAAAATAVEVRELQVLQTQGAVQAVDLVAAVQADQALSSFPTQAHNEEQAVRSHQAVATLFTHLQLAVHLQLN